jgi:myo-inositol 2-dehydrogenase / D-chiro-inositol 1-dehydrogenase
MYQPSLSRRRFIKCAGAGIGLFQVVPRYVLGGPGNTPPSEMITRGVIGTGRQGMSHVTGYPKTLAVCDVDKNHLAAALRKAGGKCDGYGDFRRILDRKDIDAVHIPTPPHWHSLVTIMAAQAGKDIFSEKPMSRFIKEGRAAVEAVKRYGAVFQVNSKPRPRGSGQLRKIVTSGILGPDAKIDAQRHVKGWFSVARKCGRTDLKPEPVPPELDYDMWLGPAPYRPYNKMRVHYNFRCYWNTAGGGMLDRGQHQMVAPLCELGLENTSPVKVEAYAPWPSHPDAVTMWGWVKMTYANGSRIILESGEWGEPSGEKSYDNVKLTPEQEKRLKQIPDLRQNTDTFEQAVKTREDWFCRQPYAEAAHRGATALHLANIAIRTGRTVHFDPVTEEIVGDEEQNRYVHGPMRAPWHI